MHDLCLRGIHLNHSATPPLIDVSLNIMKFLKHTCIIINKKICIQTFLDFYRTNEEIDIKRVVLMTYVELFVEIAQKNHLYLQVSL